MSTATITDPVIATDKVAVKTAIETLNTTTAEIGHYQIGQMIFFYKSV
jgi:hypothetical protein